MNQVIHFSGAWALAFCLSILANHAAAESYLIDSLEFPKDMPPEIGALDFASDGMLYVSLRRGDTMTAKPSKDPKDFRWKRFATGFHFYIVLCILRAFNPSPVASDALPRAAVSV